MISQDGAVRDDAAHLLTNAEMGNRDRRRR
jgi:hypothetical protein